MEIPPTILEVKGGRDKCYDQMANIISEVKQIKTMWRSNSSLAHLIDRYDIPPQC